MHTTELLINGVLLHWRWIAASYWTSIQQLIADLDRFAATAKARKAEKRAAA
jgi:hypothetical protein